MAGMSRANLSAGRKMDKSEIRNALKALGWTQGRLASVMGMSADGVSKWFLGARPVPAYAAAYVKLLLDYRNALDERDRLARAVLDGSEARRRALGL